MAGKNRTGKCRRNDGFTLLETLLTVAILVILLGLSMVGIARYRNHLKITELDNAARDIYMAAQNRAVLLQNSGRLSSYITGTNGMAVKLSVGGPEGATGNGGTRYISNKAGDTNILNELIPVGTIDPALREKGEFYVVYEPDSGSATDVFYMEKKSGSTLPDIGEELVTLAAKTRTERIQYLVGSDSVMVGYYGGRNADEIDTKPLPTPGVEVFIENGDELTLTVRYTMPALPDGLPENEFGNLSLDREPKVTLKYGAEEIKLLYIDNTTQIVCSPYPMRLTDETKSSDITNQHKTNTSAEYTWILDSLEQDASGNYIKQFKGLTGSSVGLGGDFTVKASLKLTADGYIESAYYATGEDNSLFAKGSTYGTTAGNPNGTALIANLRHLQNLCDSESTGFTSKVGVGITKAQQLCDIDCTYAKDNNGTVLMKDEAGNPQPYSFTPVVNTSMDSYNGKYENKNTYIFNLSTKNTANAGLFGTASNLTITDTRVCWNKPEKLVEPEENPTAYVYAVSGANAGGLVGNVSGTVNITNSFAATTVKSASSTGGLVGFVESGTLNITNSYADCYLSGDKVGGLVGSGTVTKLENCYAAGFIVDPTNTEKTAGLVNGSVENASKSYSVVRILKNNTLGKPATPLYGSGVGDGSGSVCYLYKSASVTDNLFGNEWEYNANERKSNVYDLRNKLSNNAADRCKPPYPFPGLKDTSGTNLSHYGDWAELEGAVPAGLVYYETYKNTTADGTISYSCGAKGQYEDQTIFSLKADTDNPVVVKDGYALVFDAEKVPASYMVTYGVDTYEYSGESFTINENGKTYALVPLPDEIVTGALADETKFFQELKTEPIKDELSASDTRFDRTFYFNPHFAGTTTVTVAAGTAEVTILDNGEKNTVYTPPAAAPAEPTGTDGFAVLVRTPRHFYDLSVFQPNYATNKEYYFKQELDLNYSTYTGYTDGFAPSGGTLPFRQFSIGPFDGPNQYFMGTYDGGCHIIENVLCAPTADLAGLFGSTGDGSGTPGDLKNIVYKLDPDPEKTQSLPALKDENGADIVYRAAGILLGKNYGIVSNCAVYGVNMNVTGKYIGGLVGYNQNTVTGCAAEVACLNAAVSTDGGAAGGLVGGQSGNIRESYAVGKISGSGTIAGLLGSGGTIENSYAAVDLAGSETRYGLCPDNVTDAGGKSGWLKDVYVYRGVKYNITATTDYRDSGKGVTFTALKGNLSTQFDAQNTIRNIPDGASYIRTYENKSFPYRTGVTGLDRDKDGKIQSNAINKAIHYGLWPAPLPVGLTYYETYRNEENAGVNGQFEEKKLTSLRDNLVVEKDGYALVFDVTDGDVPVGNYKIKYGSAEYTLTKNPDGTMNPEGIDITWCWNGYSYREYIYTATVDDVTYTLVALPHSVVTGAMPEGDVVGAKFYQRLIYGEGLDSERTFCFNPHFAKTVVAGTVSLKDGKTDYAKPITPGNPTNIGLVTTGNGYTTLTFPHSEIDRQWGGMAISVRTPRHLYNLSRFQNTYVVESTSGTKLYYFKQELDLDYKTYHWYGDNQPTDKGAYYAQDPIGRDVAGGKWNELEGKGFQGSYNGDNHWIRHVFYHTDLTDLEKYGNYDKKSEYIGMFRYIEYPFNIKYEVPDVSFDAGALTTNAEFRVGTMFGGAFRAANCVAALNNMTVTSSKTDSVLCVGGLLGYTNTMDDCQVTIKGTLNVLGAERTTNSGGTTVYTGGLAGRLRNLARNCSSEANSIVVRGGNNVHAGGLTGYSSVANKAEYRKISNSYVVIGTINVTAGSENVYAGGLTGWCDRIDHSTAVVTGGLRITRSGTSSLSSAGAFGGGLAGGANDIRSCAAIVSSVSVTGSGSTRYAGGLVGVLKTRWTTGDPQPPRDYNSSEDPWGFRVKDSYAAVAKLTAYSNNTVGALCGYSLNSPNATGTMTAPTISNSYYLGGSANAWHFGATNYAGMSNSGGGTAKTYANLQSTAIIDMGKVSGSNVFPFPIPTKKDGAWFYPGTDWPKTGAAASPAFEAPFEMETMPALAACVIDMMLPPELVTGLEAEPELEEESETTP